MALSNKARLCDQVRFTHIADADGTWDGTTDPMLDMRDYDGCCIVICATTVAVDATHFLEFAKVVSNSDSDGGGTDHDIAEAVTTDGGSTKTLTGSNYGTAVNTAQNQQMIVLDVRADQMYAGDRYIGLVTTVNAGGTYPIHILYIQYNGNFSYKDMFQFAGTRTAFQYDGDLS